MSLSALMSRLQITETPASWTRQFELAHGTLNDHVLPDQGTLRQFCAQHNLPETQMKQMLSCREMILNQEDYLLLWHLYYTVLLVIHDCQDEHWQTWPAPAQFPEGDFSVFRTLLMLAHFDALTDLVRFHQLPESLIDDAVQSLIGITGRHFEDEGFYGISNNKMWWQQLFMRGMIFRVGRLQYEISSYDNKYKIYQNQSGDTAVLCADSDARYDEQGLLSATGIYHPAFMESPRHITGYGYDASGCFVPEKIRLSRRDWQPALETGDDVLSVHIPADGKLTPSLVEASLAQALDFCHRYFPNKRFKAFVCHTWLFNTQLQMFLPENSNILAFQKLFRIMMEHPDGYCLFSFVFDQPACPLEKLQPKTRFQQLVLDHVKAGKKLYGGFGYRLIR